MQREDETQNRSRPPGMPGWLKISGALVAVIVIVVIVVSLADGGGGHGPNQHGAEGMATQDVPTAAVTLG